MQWPFRASLSGILKFLLCVVRIDNRDLAAVLLNAAHIVVSQPPVKLHTLR